MNSKIDKVRKSDAKKRWKLLAQNLIKSKTRSENKDDYTEESSISVRRFKGFDIFQYKKEREDEHGVWYKVESEKHLKLKTPSIRLLSNRIDPEILIGFNNTGNICIWPSEEVLAYFCLNNKEKFRDKKICELGGGMTALAGLLLATESNAEEVHLTDGNKESAKNIADIVQENDRLFGNTRVRSRQLLWAKDQLSAQKNVFDFILCADCCYFLEYQQGLIETISELLSEKGEAILFAPKRGNTLDTFVNLANVSFTTQVVENYDKEIWQKYQKFKEGRSSFDPDIHYPLMVIMQKKGNPN
ncbi:calmodulin-lysine N-methyltransferase-like [Rhopilema esculentum]|uniref:calmodulin-lysine N-methyltransferase-like n=1 Tax=Rhopilema esculentum TaxID=499914 RepID=UPI0031E0FA80